MKYKEYKPSWNVGTDSEDSYRTMFRWGNPNYAEEPTEEFYKQGEEQIGDMCAVYVGIGHNNDFIVSKFGNIKIISVAFRKSTAESVNHGFNFRIGQNLVDARFFHI